MKEWIVGRNPVYETLVARRRQPFRLLLAEGTHEKGRLAEILKLARSKKLPVEIVQRNHLDRLGSSHQGIALEASHYPYVHLVDILDLAGKRGEAAFILILDTLQDPQNLGTLFRTAEAMGVHGVLLPLRHTATVTPAVVSASSGASEHLLIAQSNLAQSIATLKENGVWVIGLEGGPESQDAGRVRLDSPLALVVGNEGEGLRQLVRDSCDLLMSLPMQGQVASLNAAVAGSIALYLASRARKTSVKPAGEG
ncbi:MAG: 23S rRNA (guanosine(2251)-2'-O)-methyltransferase RlmB [Chloroflexota bacterium]|nr:MAG: 23S rRNA (guanosine(2251)-2'-O)-methyltransferase RlmB [Chloroflexota bacterium]